MAKLLKDMKISLILGNIKQEIDYTGNFQNKLKKNFNYLH